jgi:hypothetical protein
MMASNATGMEIPAVIDYTTINLRTGISVTRKVVLTTYFEHLRFVVPSCLQKTSDHYWKSMTMQTRVMTKSTTNWKVSSLSLFVHGCSIIVFVVELSWSLLMLPVLTKTYPPGPERRKILFGKRRNRRMPMPYKSSVINAGVSNSNRMNAIEKLLSPN